jgi:anaerobic selenocysteine-containing dehydrogenase
MRQKHMADFRYCNVEKEMVTYGFDGVVKSHCRMCHGGCGVLVYTRNGKVAKIPPASTFIRNRR